MTLHFNVYIADRKSLCRMCHKNIIGGDIVVQATGYRTAGNTHYDCIVEEARKVIR